MDGLDVLNTTAAHVSAFGIFVGIIFGLFALFCVIGIVVAISEEEAVSCLVALVMAVIVGLLSFVVLTVPDVPTRYEVTVRDGAAIDATKFNVIEQHGKVFVIEERK